MASPESTARWRGARWCQPGAAKSRHDGEIITRVLLTSLIYPGNIVRQNWRISMNPVSDAGYVAFDGDRCIASGDLRAVARAAKEALERRKDAPILVFDGRSGPIEIDF